MDWSTRLFAMPANWTRSMPLECGGRPLEPGFVGLTVGPYRVQPLVPQPGRHSGQIDRLDQAPGRVVAETMRMHVRDLCAPAEFGNQVLDPARRVRPALAAEHGATDVVDGHGLNRLQRFAPLDVQRQPPALVALADDIDPAGAGLEVDALPGERDQLVDGPLGVGQGIYRFGGLTPQLTDELKLAVRAKLMAKEWSLRTGQPPLVNRIVVWLAAQRLHHCSIDHSRVG